MKRLVVDIGRVDANIVWMDTENKRVETRNIYLYGDNYTTHDVVKFILNVIQEFGANEVWVNNDSRGNSVYSHICYETRGWDSTEIVEYKPGRLYTSKYNKMANNI